MPVEGKFKLVVMSPEETVFEGDVSSLYLPGDTGEFEILPCHYPLLSLLRDGNIIIDGESSIPINHGIIKFFKNECTILVQINEFAFIEGADQYFS